MTKTLDDEQAEVLVEKSIIQAFGDSIIEFESVLFHKYLISSGPNSLITPTWFRKYLIKMHAKGYLIPLSFHKKRAWKRLIIADFVNHDVILTETNKPIKTEPLITSTSKENHEQVHEHLVTDCREVAKEIISMMKTHRQFGLDTDQKAMALLYEHIRKMHHALTESKRHFYLYLDTNLPDLREPLKYIIESRGEEKVLLGLRVIRSIP